MDHQYVDMYLRKKRGMLDSTATAYAANTTAAGAHQQQQSFSMMNSTAAAMGTNLNNNAHHHEASIVDRQMDAVLRSAAGVQQFVDRADELSQQVETFEDKLTNLAKLVKLSQTLQDEKEADLRKQNQELKARLKRQEQVAYRLEKEIEALKANQGQVGTSVLARIENNELRCTAIDQALSDFMGAYKDGCRQTANQQTELARSLKELAEAHEASRVGITGDLQSVKEWATRNLTRLKKHVDLQNADLNALRESHLETSTQLQKVQQQTDNEHEKLLALLQQKSREANLLTEIVDKEIQSIHTMTQQHRAGLGGKLATTTTTSNTDDQQHGKFSTDNTARISYNTEGTTTTASKKRSLYDELAFTK